MNAEEKIIQAKIWLSKAEKYPFFGYLLFMLIPKACHSVEVERKFKDTKTGKIKKMKVKESTIPTAGVGRDAQYLYYNPDFIDTLKDKHIRAVMVHEILHLALGHLWRVGSKDHLIWNYAADYAINVDLNTYKGMRLPEGVLYDKKYKGWPTEQIYYDLIKRLNNNKKKIRLGFANGKGGQINKDVLIDRKGFGDGAMGDHGKWYEGNGKSQEKKWQRACKQAAEVHNKKAGDLPGEIQILIDAAMPKVDWREVLINYVVKSYDDFSYNPPDRRFLSGEFILPSMEDGDKIDEVVVAVDTSGSIEPEMLNKFAAEVRGLLGSFKNIKTHFCSWDTRVYDWKEVDDWQANIQYFGGGGTDISCVFDEIKKRDITPTVLLVFTDGYFNCPPEEPSYDVIFLLTKKDYEKPPFGRHLLYD